MESFLVGAWFSIFEERGWKNPDLTISNWKFDSVKGYEAVLGGQFEAQFLDCVELQGTLKVHLQVTFSRLD